MTTVADLCTALEQFAPCRLAGDWDNVGLLLGDSATPIANVLTCLTVTPEVVEEAIAGAVDLIVTHHPILFRAVKRLTSQTVEGRMILALARAGIAVYSPHTAFDNTVGGINDQIAQALGLKAIVPLRQREAAPQSKIVVFLPENDLVPVREALFAHGAGQIGAYRDCSFRTSGIGTFFGNESTNPTVGQKGRREEVAEYRLEVICPNDSLEAVLRAMRQAHSYEEPAFDVYPVKSVGVGPGEGRIGTLAEPMTLEAIAGIAKDYFRVSQLQVQGDALQKIERVSIVCGAGGSMLSDALRKKADLFLTGELRFHEMLEAQAHGMATLLPGHYASERIAVEWLAELLQRQFANLRVWPSQKESDPTQWLGDRVTITT